MRFPSKRWAATLTLLSTWLTAPAASALPIVLTLAVSATTPGPFELDDTILLDLIANGLSGTGAPSLTAYEIDLTYDESVLDFVSVSFGPYLGNPTNGSGDPCTLANLDLGDPTPQCGVVVGATPSPGLLALGSSSLFGPGDLNASQPEEIPLATLEFQVSGLGSTTFLFPEPVLTGTQPGAPLVEGSLPGAGGPLNVNVVPEPGTALLLGSGLALLAARRKRAR